MKKSYIASLLLTVFFGPIGLFYSSIAAAIGLTLAAILLGSFTAGIGFLFSWPLAIIIGLLAVRRHNKMVSIENRRHDELVQATREGTALK